MPEKHVQTQAEWEETMAQRVFAAVRGDLYLALPYMNAALCALSPISKPSLRSFATDGAGLYFAPSWLLRIYRSNRKYLPRAYLHSVLHCVFRHLWLRGDRDPVLWGIACDICVENVLDHLNITSLKRPVGWLRQKTYADLAQRCRLLSAGPVYRELCTLDAEELTRLHQEFYCDDHSSWPKDPDAPSAQMQGKRWEQLGRETQLSMQQGGSRASDAEAATALEAQVQAGRGRKLYRDFLRRFAVWREEPHLDLDEFDLGYYSYGLRTYGNMPLIEPLETRESKRVRDLVIVLDTSESTSGDLVKAFLKETFAILKTTETFFVHCRILVLQCDDAVRSETLLSDLNALDRYASDFVLKGGGGTDFRPAFTRIDELRKLGTLRDLQGVLYFTDGKGIYPARRPPYDVAFLFLDTGEPVPDVPPWAMRLTLEPDEFIKPQAPKLPDFTLPDDLDELPQL